MLFFCPDGNFSTTFKETPSDFIKKAPVSFQIISSFSKTGMYVLIIEKLVYLPTNDYV